MSVAKKRKLSPGASSRASSSTPAPSLPTHIHTDQTNESPDSPTPFDTLSVPGPSRSTFSASATPIPSSSTSEIIQEARTGAIVPNSGDGIDTGEECFLWADLPMNKQGFRYIACTPSTLKSPVPVYGLYRTIPGPSSCPPVHLSWTDRSYFLRISPTATTISTDRGFRSARTNVGVREGTWYYETVILRGHGDKGRGGGTGGDNGNPHIRLGWARREANLDAPIGMDGYGYGIRDVNGDKVHISRPKPYGKSFKTGDVVGCLIKLPPRHDSLDQFKRKRSYLKWKGNFYFESAEYTPQKEMEALADREGKIAAAAKAAAEAAKEEVNQPKKKGKKNVVEEVDTGPVARQLPILEGSNVEFFLNGQSLGVAFEDVYDFAPLPSTAVPQAKKGVDPKIYDDGTLGYYPMVSCFGRAKVQCNFGPDFRYPPPSGVRPMCERYAEHRQVEVQLDDRDEMVDFARLEKEAVEIEKAKAKKRQMTDNKSALAGKKGSNKKTVKRKGTETPSGTPGPEEIKVERDAARSRLGTEDSVKREDDKDSIMGDEESMSGRIKADPSEAGEDGDEGVRWD